MGTKVDLPNGGWAEIKDPEELTNRDRKLLRRYVLGMRATREKLLAAGITPGVTPADLSPEEEERLEGLLDADELDAISNVQGAFIVAYTASWSLDGPLPTMDTVDDLPGPVFDKLADATADLGDGSLEVSPDQALDADSPTGPSPA